MVCLKSNCTQSFKYNIKKRKKGKKEKEEKEETEEKLKK